MEKVGKSDRGSGGPECHKLAIDTREHQGLPREWGKVVRGCYKT